MNINRIANKVTKSFLMDPYAMLMHYKRAFKLMKVMKDNHAKVLILGNKNQFGIDWKGRFEGMDFDTGIVDEKVISGAPKHYQMILCLDPVLYCRSLQGLNVPVMMCATAREITEHPEILDVTDYLLPSPSSRHDAALRQLIASEAGLGNASGSRPPAEAAAASAAEREGRGKPEASSRRALQEAAPAAAAAASPDKAPSESDSVQAPAEAPSPEAAAVSAQVTTSGPEGKKSSDGDSEQAFNVLTDGGSSQAGREEKPSTKGVPEE